MSWQFTVPQGASGFNSAAYATEESFDSDFTAALAAFEASLEGTDVESTAAALAQAKALQSAVDGVLSSGVVGADGAGFVVNLSGHVATGNGVGTSATVNITQVYAAPAAPAPAPEPAPAGEEGAAAELDIQEAPAEAPVPEAAPIEPEPEMAEAVPEAV
jgi:hypothetical protein